jgi:hypothetical protein
MARDWEETFRSWSKPSSDTEEEKCDNAERMIKESIRSDPKLSSLKIDVFAQGSYRNNTNVRQNSDVDICVCYKGAFFSELPPNQPDLLKRRGYSDGKYLYTDFKQDLHQALINKFGKDGIKKGKKAFDVHPNSYRVDADVVPTFEYKKFNGLTNPDGSLQYISGTKLYSDNGDGIINWPSYHFENGVEKNKATKNRYKFIVRVLKRLRYDMTDHGITEAHDAPSFLIECLVYNVPNHLFGSAHYYEDVRSVLIHTFNATKDDSTCAGWKEVSGLKDLFQVNQPWTRKNANDFILAAWRYVGFQ